MQTVLGWLGMGLVLALVGCANKAAYPMMGSGLLPAAAGTVVIKDRDKPNKTLEVQVQHLAKPETLPGDALGEASATARTYVVWIKPVGDSTPENAGVLNPNDKLEAKLETSTSQRYFEVFVTPEPSPTANTPTGKKVLQATVSP